MEKKPKAKKAKAGLTVTYVGDRPAVLFKGTVYSQGAPVPVEDASAFEGRDYFEVSRGDVHEG